MNQFSFHMASTNQFEHATLQHQIYFNLKYIYFLFNSKNLHFNFLRLDVFNLCGP